MFEEPTGETIAADAERLGVSIDAATAEAFAEQFAGQDAVLDALGALAPDEPPTRDHWKPADDPLGAFLCRCSIGGGEGPLAGRTVGVKDNLAVAGVPMTCGSPVLEGYVPEFDATVVERLLAAGAEITGKTNMDEFAFGGDRSTMRFRLAHNPHDRDRQPGSSSAGSGVAATTGAVDLAVGSDTGGSIRFPAAWSGVPGLKPTRGLVSHHGFVQYAKTLDTVGVLSQEVRLLAAGLDAVAGFDPRDERTRLAATAGREASGADGTRGHGAGSLADVVAAADGSPDGLRIGVPAELADNAPRLDAVTADALAELAAAGAELVEVSIPDYELWLPGWLAIGMTEVGNYARAGGTNHWLLSDPWPSLAAALEAGFGERGDEVGETFLAARLYAEHLARAGGSRAYALAHEARERVTAGVDEALREVDVLASTTVPLLPPEWGEGIDDVFGALANTAPFNLSGHPAVSVPCGQVEGLPVGLQFVGRQFDERAVLHAAGHWEAMYDWERPA